MRALQRKLSPSNTTSCKLGLMATLMGILAPLTALAASGAHEDGSGFFVWVFLGFCALIVVAQVVPAILLMLGLAKGVTSVVKKDMAEVKK